jgi:hypothetical protein
MKILRYLLIAVFLWNWALAEDPKPAGMDLPKPIVSLPFPVGESLVYDLYWGWIGVGQSVATTDWEWDEEGKRWLLLIRFRTKSNGVLEKLYPVDDTVETRVDPLTLRPLSFHINLNEGRHSRDEKTIFDWETLQASFKGVKNGKEREKTFPIKANTRDIVSFMYFMRQTPFAEKGEYDFEVLSDEKLYELKVLSRKLEKINLKEYGKVESLKLNPKAAFDGVFVRKGEMEIWVSRDPRQIITKAEVDTPFANVKVLLRSVSGPGDDFWVKPKDKTSKK